MRSAAARRLLRLGPAPGPRPYRAPARRARADQSRSRTSRAPNPPTPWLQAKSAPSGTLTQRGVGSVGKRAVGEAHAARRGVGGEGRRGPKHVGIRTGKGLQVDVLAPLMVEQRGQLLHVGQPPGHAGVACFAACMGQRLDPRLHERRTSATLAVEGASLDATAPGQPRVPVGHFLLIGRKHEALAAGHFAVHETHGPRAGPELRADRPRPKKKSLPQASSFSSCKPRARPAPQ
jgi:hypothetical protein